MAPRVAKRTRITIGINDEEHRRLGGLIMKRNEKLRSKKVFANRWVSFFGLDVPACVDAWMRLDIEVEEEEHRGVEPVHLLWGLMMLGRTDSTAILALEAGCDDKTFRKWAKFFIVKLSSLSFDLVRPCLLCSFD